MSSPPVVKKVLSLTVKPPMPMPMRCSASLSGGGFKNVAALSARPGTEPECASPTLNIKIADTSGIGDSTGSSTTFMPLPSW
jgi:hypothetical protein